MALNAATLATEIRAELITQGFADYGGNTYLQKLAAAIADAVVPHITTNAVVTTTSGAPDGEHEGEIS